MTFALAQILGVVQEGLWVGFVVFLRVAAMTSVMPAFGERSVPTRVKLALALSFSVIVMPFVAIEELRQPVGLSWVVYSVTEPMAGLVLGIGLRMFVFVLQTAGSMAAQATSLSQLLGAAGGEPIPAIGHVLVVAGLALAVLAGLHVRVAELLIYSYSVFPVGEFIPANAGAQWGIAQISRVFSLSFTLAAPFVIVSIVYNLTLGVINRAMPQLMVAFVGAPVITAGGLSLLFLVSPLLFATWLEALGGFLADPLGGPQ